MKIYQIFRFLTEQTWLHPRFLQVAGRFLLMNRHTGSISTLKLHAALKSSLQIKILDIEESVCLSENKTTRHFESATVSLHRTYFQRRRANLYHLIHCRRSTMHYSLFARSLTICIGCTTDRWFNLHVAYPPRKLRNRYTVLTTRRTVKTFQLLSVARRELQHCARNCCSLTSTTFRYLVFALFFTGNFKRII